MKIVTTLALLVGGWFAFFELTMSPTASDRLTMGLVVAGATAVTVAVAWALPRWTSRSTSMRIELTVLSVASLLVTIVAVGVAAGLMFLSAHDLKLLIVVLVFAGGLGMAFSAVVAVQATDDLKRISAAADHIARGDLTVRTGVDRRDELGSLAHAVDALAERLAAADEFRSVAERHRQEFLSAIGHDLRTPLTALQAAVEALEDGVATDRDRYIRSMRRDIAAMRTLVDDLFMLARVEARELDISHDGVDLAELADDALEALAPVAERKGVIVNLATDGRVGVEGSPELLGRAIRNLLDNAIRHAPVDSEVTVQVDNGNQATLVVRDEGPGFSAAFVGSAFDSFVRDDPARDRRTGGAGLGLAIARGVVEAHGGEIWAEEGPGGRVAFRLPSRDAGLSG